MFAYTKRQRREQKDATVFSRTIGWATFSFGLASLADRTFTATTLSRGLIVCMILLGLWLLLRSGQPFGFSQSTRNLLQEARASRAGKASFLHINGPKKGFKTTAQINQYWSLAIVALLGAFLSVGYILPEERSLVWVGLVCTVITMLIAVRKRRAEEREILRIIVVITFAASAGMIAFKADSNFLYSLLITVIIACTGGFAAWLSYGRESYAKYFFLTALALLTLFALQSLSSGWLVLLSFALGVMALIWGVFFAAYTVRLVGLLAVFSSVAMYFLEILPSAPAYSIENPIFNRAGLGLLLAILLPVIADWYFHATLPASEKKWQKSMLRGSFVASLFILLAVIMLNASGLEQSLLWLVLAIITGVIAVFKGSHLLWVSGTSLFGASLAKLSFIDSLNLSQIFRLEIWLSAVVLLVIGYLYIRRYPVRFLVSSNV